MEKIFKKIIQIIFIITVLGFIGKVEYYHWVTLRHATEEVLVGEVIQSREPTGRDTSCMAIVRFEDGVVETLNTGSQYYSVSSIFINRMEWNPIVGLTTGTAYIREPTGYSMFLSVCHIVLVEVIMVLGVVVLIQLVIWSFKK